MPSPNISIIIPCLNEEKFLPSCLDSVIKNEYDHKNIEIIIVDGLSTDNTREIIKTYQEKYSFIYLLDNPKKITPAALNIGIKNSNYDYIIRLDAHSRYPVNYFKLCVEYLLNTDADNVGGVVESIPGSDSIISKCFSWALSSVFGVGNSKFRTGINKDYEYVDTVPFGAFKKSIFNKIGLFDETLPRNEDIDLNRRIIQKGGKILLVSKIKIYYLCNDAIDLLKKIFENGFLTTQPLRQGKFPFSIRHLIPLLFIICLSITFLLSTFSGRFDVLFLFILSSYIALNLFFTIKIFLVEGITKTLITLPIVFSLIHLSHGFGALYGLAIVFLSMFKKLTIFSVNHD